MRPGGAGGLADRVDLQIFVRSVRISLEQK